jgi:hypothetical protein
MINIIRHFPGHDSLLKSGHNLIFYYAQQNGAFAIAIVMFLNTNSYSLKLRFMIPSSKPNKLLRFSHRRLRSRDTFKVDLLIHTTASAKDCSSKTNSKTTQHHLVSQSFKMAPLPTTTIITNTSQISAETVCSLHLSSFPLHPFQITPSHTSFPQYSTNTPSPTHRSTSSPAPTTTTPESPAKQSVS